MDIRVGRRRSSERGATLVEAALVFPLLLMVIFGIVEYSLAFKDWLSVSHAAREGARAGATFGADVYADMQVLEGIAATLATVAIDGGVTVRISNPASGDGTNYSYEPGTGCTGSDCCDWVPCPDPDRLPPTYVVPLWNPTSRDVSAPSTDRISVEVTATHKWVTGFFADESDFTSETNYQIEPQVFDT